MKNKSAEKIKLTSFDDLFGTKDNSVEGIYTTVALSQLHPFKNHPFKVLDDEKMQELVGTIKEHGVMTPATVRPEKDGNGYEIVAGHRRHRGSELAGLEEMPCIVREMTDLKLSGKCGTATNSAAIRSPASWQSSWIWRWRPSSARGPARKMRRRPRPG